MKIKLPKKIVECFDAYKAKYNDETYDGMAYKNINSIVGKLWWVEPKEVLWLYATNNDEEGYEGSQTQIGIKKDGALVWAFYSHCSCNWYSDYTGKIKQGDKIVDDYHELAEDSYKEYLLEKVDKNVVNLIEKRLTEMAKQGLS